MHNNLAIYCGTNGAGKSTLRLLNQDVVQIVIDSDHIAMQINPTNPRLADLEAGRKAIELFHFAMKSSFLITQANLRKQCCTLKISKLRKLLMNWWIGVKCC